MRAYGGVSLEYQSSQSGYTSRTYARKARWSGARTSISTARPCTIVANVSPIVWHALTCGRARRCRKRAES